MDPRTIPSIMRGAVDLTALRDRATTERRAAEQTASSPAITSATTSSAQPASTSGPVSTSGPASVPGATPTPANGARAPGGVMVVDVTEGTFQSEVLERSLSTPVVIDFWADWCGPCKQLSPVLEKLAMEGGGSWVLARIDVDANPRLAQAFRVQGIPMVFAVVAGQPVDAFTGVVPESQLRPWIDAVLKAGGAAMTAPVDPALAAADEAMVNGNLAEAERAYKKILSDRPADAAAQAGLAQVGLLRRVEGVNPKAVLAAAASAPHDVAAQALAADVEVLSGRAPQAYQRMVDLVRRVSGEDRDKARTHLVSLFAVAAPDDPSVMTARRALASALY